MPCRFTPFPLCANCQVHYGFYEDWLELSPQILAALDGMNAPTAAGVLCPRRSAAVLFMA